MSRRPRPVALLASWRQMLVWGAVLAIGTLVLSWLDYQRIARTRSEEVYIFLTALLFLIVGVAAGVRLANPRPLPTIEGNPAALAELGISAREYDVLAELAAGRSNKEIADRLAISPNTVKTHVARLYEKLGAARRTDAIQRARDLGILA